MLRNIMDNNNITYQFGELGKVDQGGGGTIAYILANYNVEVACLSRYYRQTGTSET